MTLTTPGCSMINIIAEDVKNKILTINTVKNAVVNVTFDPPWTPDMMTEEGKEKLGFKSAKDNANDTKWE